MEEKPSDTIGERAAISPPNQPSQPYQAQPVSSQPIRDPPSSAYPQSRGIEPDVAMAKGDSQNYESRPTAWDHSMCGCFGDMGACCLGFWCPCMTYGKIHHRLRNEDESDYSSCNGPCWGFCGLTICGLQWVMGMMQRGEIRHQYNLDGSGCGDCMRHWCCACCTLVQENRETMSRTKAKRGNQAGYQQQAGMVYGSPQPQQQPQQPPQQPQFQQQPQYQQQQPQYQQGPGYPQQPTYQ